MKRRDLLAASGTAAVALAGCTNAYGTGDDDATTDGGGAGSESGSGKTVQMTGTAFEPVKLSVDTGTTVKWVNEDPYEHNVQAAQLTEGAAEWDFESENLKEGDAATHTFESAGAYTYYCTIHGKGTMCGAVVVGDASLSGSLPCSSGGGGGGDDGGGGY